MRLALGLFFVLSGVHKLTNKERHKIFVETLRVLGIPHIGILQWFVPGVEFFGGLGLSKASAGVAEGVPDRTVICAFSQKKMRSPIWPRRRGILGRQ